ncbi:MAG: FAD-dependent oxidoreductase, partial [Planctomycetota bacterium]
MERRDLATDVLVIGNGGAGLRAAVEAAEQGCAVILASKLSRDKPNSTAVIAGWGTHRPPDEADDYFRMVVEEGNYLNDQELAWIYAHEVVERMPELRRFGVEMRLDDSSLERPGTISELWFFPGPKGRLGDAIRDPLRRTADEQGVETLDNTLVTGLLSSDESVVGATALDLVSGELLVISAKVVVLATGGASGIYARQNNPPGT